MVSIIKLKYKYICNKIFQTSSQERKRKGNIQERREDQKEGITKEGKKENSKQRKIIKDL